VGSNRDPKVVWHEPTKRWIMALYLDKNDYGLFASPNLKSWTQLQTLTVPDCGECPDFFPMPVDGDKGNVKWVFTAANGRYLVGSFDGNKFVPSGGLHEANWGGWYYAVQSYSDIPATDGRRIQIAWMAGGQYPGMPFNQQMNFPCEMTLRSLPEGLRICRNPVREIESLRVKTRTEGQDPFGVTADLLDIEAEFEPGQAAESGFEICGERLIYSLKNRTLSFLGKSAPVRLVEGRLRLRILVDRTSTEVYANDGRVSMSFCWLPKPDHRKLGMFVAGGVMKIVSLRVHELKSAWHR
jgi:sucrose-6-phosphate hydrolase SacC (GH32 family)